MWKNFEQDSLHWAKVAARSQADETLVRGTHLDSVSAPRRTSAVRTMAALMSVAFALALLPGRPGFVLTISRPTASRASMMMMMDPPERFRRMEAALAELELLEVSQAVIIGLKSELGELKNAGLATAPSVASDEECPVDNAQIVAEVEEAKAELMRSIRLGDIDRIALLRALQIKWHPDKCMGIEDEAMKQMTQGLSAKINEAMRVAKANVKAREERDAFLIKVHCGGVSPPDPRKDPTLEFVRTPWGSAARKKPGTGDAQ